LSTSSIALAFAGPGAVTQDNVRDLLNDFLGFEGEDADGFPVPPEDREITLIIALTGDEEEGDGIQEVVDYTEYTDWPFIAVVPKGVKIKDANEVVEATATFGIHATLLNALSEADADEKYVVALWGEEEITEDDPRETLLDLATAAGFTVKDLTAGLDDVVFDTSSDEPVEPDPEPEPEAPKTRGRRGKKVEPLEEVEEPLTEAAAEPAGDTLEEQVARAAKPAKKAQVVSESFDLTGTLAVLQKVYTPLRLADEMRAAASLTEIQYGPLTALVKGEIDRLAGLATEFVEVPEEPAQPQVEAPAAEEPKRRVGRPRKDPDSEDMVTLIDYEDGTFSVAGRGRPRKDEVRKQVTKAEFEALKKAGKIE
jgi:hypothetical protein